MGYLHINSSILEFEVELGYAYCKILDFRNIREFDGVLVKVFDYIVQQPIMEMNVLREKHWLFGARRMPWVPGTRGKGAWKFKGVLISKDDNVIPDFKYSIKYFPFEKDKSKLGPWHVLRNINELSKEVYSYESVRHLEDTVVSVRGAIEKRTAMEYYRMNGMNAEEHFDLSDPAVQIAYYQMVSVPIYKTIPKEIRGKAIQSDAV